MSDLPKVSTEYDAESIAQETIKRILEVERSKENEGFNLIPTSHQNVELWQFSDPVSGWPCIKTVGILPVSVKVLNWKYGCLFESLNNL